MMTSRQYCSRFHLVWTSWNPGKASSQVNNQCHNSIHSLVDVIMVEATVVVVDVDADHKDETNGVTTPGGLPRPVLQVSLTTTTSLPVISVANLDIRRMAIYCDIIITIY